MVGLIYRLRCEWWALYTDQGVNGGPYIQTEV